MKKKLRIPKAPKSAEQKTYKRKVRRSWGKISPETKIHQSKKKKVENDEAWEDEAREDLDW